MVYAPGTLETDPKKQNMALQQQAKVISSATDDITALQTQTSGYESAWANYTPTIDAAAGSFTTVSGTGRYKQIGKTTFFTVTITITTNGTAASWVRATLPATAANANFSLSARDDTAGIELHARIAASSTRADIFKIDGTYPGADGKTLFLSGVYEAA